MAVVSSVTQRLPWTVTRFSIDHYVF